jgi:hypothetical protein
MARKKKKRNNEPDRNSVKSVADTFPDHLLPVSLMAKNTDNIDRFHLFIHEVENDGGVKNLFQDQFLSVINPRTGIQPEILPRASPSRSPFLTEPKLNIVRNVRNIVDRFA